MRKLKYIFSLICLVVILSAYTGIAQISDELTDYVTRIKEADKVERLYTIRYGLDKLYEQPNLTIAEQRELSNAYLLLANAFKSRNHFRNAVDVYFDYLKLKENYRKRYIHFVTDSLNNENKQTSARELEKIAQLDNEITRLNDQLIVVSGMKQKYYTYGGIAASLILIIGGMIFLNRNRAINASLKQLEKNRLDLQSLYMSVGNTSMMIGSIEYAKHVSTDSENKISDIIDYFNDKPKSTSDEESIKALIRARNKLKNPNI